MAKLQMQKIERAALLKDSQNIIERLQRRGVVELVNIEDDRLVKMNTNSMTAQFDRSLNTANTALEYLKPYSEKKGSLFDSLNG